MSDAWQRSVDQMAREADYVGLRDRHLEPLSNADLATLWVNTLKTLVGKWVSDEPKHLVLVQLFEDADSEHRIRNLPRPEGEVAALIEWLQDAFMPGSPEPPPPGTRLN